MIGTCNGHNRARQVGGIRDVVLQLLQEFTADHKGRGSSNSRGNSGGEHLTRHEAQEEAVRRAGHVSRLCRCVVCFGLFRVVVINQVRNVLSVIGRLLGLLVQVSNLVFRRLLLLVWARHGRRPLPLQPLAHLSRSIGRPRGWCWCWLGLAT